MIHNKDNYMILFKNGDALGKGFFTQDIDMVVGAKKFIKNGLPFVVVEKANLTIKNDGSISEVGIDWDNPDGYGERIIPTPTE